MQALGLIETKGLIAAIESADAMLKAADVNLLEKTYVGGGLVSIVVTGDVGAVKAAVEAAGAAVKIINSTLLVSQHVIPRPHQDLDNVIISGIPLKNKSTVISAKTEFEEETTVEVIEEDTTDVTVKINDLVVDDLMDKEFLTEETSLHLKMDLSEFHNKQAIDKIVLEFGLEEAIEVLNKFKVVELRNLAREYKNFGIEGRKISKADKKILLTEFKKYYKNN